MTSERSVYMLVFCLHVGILFVVVRVRVKEESRDGD